jgi:hypothetical protein
MRGIMRAPSLPSFALAILVIWPSTAFAYLDPVTGSFLLQGILAGLLALGVTFRKFWRRVLERIGIVASRRRSLKR